ncbi:S8 family serine peptidase [Conexibacter woesei]|uniref:S8 family serine peptidase n=1 Tax=Conexibacter woesei TaxID=191495 RepID=UPI0004003AF8|nr:S8 family serine peptidase [Conexibacter woesei]
MTRAAPILAALCTTVLVLAETATETHAERLVVGLRGPVSAATDTRIVQESGTRLVRPIAPLDALQLSVASARRAAALATLRADADVAFAVVDTVVHAPDGPLGPPIAGIARVPNDRGFPRQHGMSQPRDHDIDAPQAWSRDTTCAKVAVLDTGVALGHRDLRPNLWRNPGEIPANGIDDDHDGYVDDVYGADVLRGSGSGADHNGHGTHVAGIIAARGDNRHGVAGVCWKAQIVSVRFLDAQATGRLGDAAAGIVYAIGKGAKVINASFAGPDPTDIMRRAVAYAQSQGALIVTSAGNAGTDDDTLPAYPASFPDQSILSVTSTDDQDHMAPTANFGAGSVDLAAPGVGIASTWPTGIYRDMSGTSQAAAFVSGAAAMLRAAAHPSLARLRNLLLDSVDRKPGLAGKTVSGGRLNLDKALHRATRNPRAQ